MSNVRLSFLAKSSTAVTSISIDPGGREENLKFQGLFVALIEYLSTVHFTPGFTGLPWKETKYIPIVTPALSRIKLPVKSLFGSSLLTDKSSFNSKEPLTTVTSMVAALTSIGLAIHAPKSH